jgi:hypothetical protein
VKQDRGFSRSCDRRPATTVIAGILLTAVALMATVAVFAGGCGSSPQPPKASMKGWELYSWQDDGGWYFSLLEGTNRTKTVAEIHAAAARLDGLKGLKPALQSIAAGQWVTWWTPSWAAGTVGFPPAAMVAQVRQICDEQGLQLQVAPEGP